MLVILSWWDIDCKWVTAYSDDGEKMLNATNHIIVIRNKINRLTIFQKGEENTSHVDIKCACNSGVNW